VPSMGAAKHWSDVAQSAKAVPPLVLKKGNLAGTSSQRNIFFGLPFATAKAIDDAAKELNTWHHSMSVLMDSKKLLFEEVKDIETMINLSFRRGNGIYVPGGGLGARTFGYRVVAFGIHLLLHGGEDHSDELAHLSEALYSMKDIPREKIGKYIFHLSRGMEEDLHRVDERGFKDAVGANEDKDMTNGEDGMSDDDTDSSIDGDDSDATVPMSPLTQWDDRDHQSVDF